jgi:hypothetical protein
MLWDKLLTPRTNDTDADSAAVQSLLDRLHWLLSFDWGSGSTGNTERLQNFLATSIQSGTTAAQVINITFTDEGFGYLGISTLPEEMATTATAGTVVQRFVAMPWAAWLFICAGFLITLICGLGNFFFLGPSAGKAS